MKSHLVNGLAFTTLFLISQATLAGDGILGIFNDPLQIVVDPSHSRVDILERRTGKVLASQRSLLIQDSERFVQTKVTSARVDGQNIKFEFECVHAKCALTGQMSFSSPNVVEFEVTSQTGATKAIQILFKDQGEHAYGVWETSHGGSLDNRGHEADFMGTQSSDNGFYASGRAPFYMTSNHYGIYVPTTAKGHFIFGVNGATGFSFEQSKLKYQFIYGPSYEEILSKYNQLAGPARVPPLWAFGVGWWRDDLHLAYHGKVKNAQENITDDADHLQGLRIPGAWYWFDRPYGTGEQGWGNFDFDSSFPDVKAMMEDLHHKGYRLLAWVANKAWGPSLLWKEAYSKSYLFKNNQFKKYSGCAMDLEQPGAYKWLLGLFERLPALGIQGYKIDRGEDTWDCIPDAQINSLNIAFAKMAAESLKSKWGDDYFNFSRNLNDTGRRYSALWGGDSYSTYGGLQASIKEGIRSGLINFPMWGSDTGGNMYGHPPKDVFARWLAFSAYSPMMEVMIGAQQTPWYDYDDEMVEITRIFSELHHDLIPYTRSMTQMASQTGMPVMRPIFLAAPDDPAAADIGDEYLYGSELLVAPIVQEGERQRSVYLPPGKWINYSNRSTVYTGSSSVKASASLKEIPVFAKEGAILPRGDILQANNNWGPEWHAHLSVEFFPSMKVENQFKYFDGHSNKTIRSTPQGENLRIEMADLGVPTEALIYLKSFETAEKNGAQLVSDRDFYFDPKTHMLRLSETGAAEITLHGAKDLFN